MLAAPAPNPYDVRFRLLGVPVRIHPYFWLSTIILGWRTMDDGDARPLVVWVVCVLASILVHEFGHALSARAFGLRPIVMLYTLGGLCDSEGDRQTPRQRLIVIAGGPGAGFALLLLTLAVASAAFGLTIREDWALCRQALGLDVGDDLRGVSLKIGRESPQLWTVLFLVWINLLWGLINLLPVYPLDGGQIAGVVLRELNPREGMRWTHMVSLATAALGAAYFLSRQEFGAGVMFAFLAFFNFRVLQALHQQRRMGLYDDEDDADWWKR